jgi:hypothetical protein
MSRMRSVASTKVTSPISLGVTARQAPAAGTKLRAFYDFLLANKGETISYKPGNGMIRSLTDTYGLDIKQIGPGRYRLIGEWTDGDYVSFPSI